MPRTQAPGPDAAGPILDFRTADVFYQQALTLAQTYTPQWSEYWPPVMKQPVAEQDQAQAAEAVNQDPGLVLLNLFAQLAGYTAGIENRIPFQRRQALFQFLAMSPRPPLAAAAPLYFTLEAGKPPQRVPAQSAVLDAQAQHIRFQTDRDLLVVPAELAAAMTLIPAQDAYIDAMPVLARAAATGANDATSVPIFVADDATDPAEAPLGHWFIMGDAELFKPDPALQGITVTLYGQQLFPQYFGQWFDGALSPLAVTLTPSADARQLDVTLKQKPLAPPLTIDALAQEIHAAEDPGAAYGIPPADASDQAPEYWLLVKPSPQAKILSSLAEQLPVISGVQCTFRGDGIQAQQAAFNVVLLDISNGAYPFGETPQTNDAFYIRSDSVFARPGARVSITFDLVPVAEQYPVVLYWQYWDGRAWQSFNETLAQMSRYQFVDTTHNLQFNAPDGPTWVQFECPVIAMTTVAGGEGLWIRAMIASGGYGESGGFVTTSVAETIGSVPDAILPPAQKTQVITYLNDVEGMNFSYHFNDAQFDPPFIRSLQIAYSYAARPTRYWTYNAFELSRFLYAPYRPVGEVLTGFYFAFAPAGFGAGTLGNRLNLYFHLQQERAAPGGKLDWQYNDGSAWQPLAVDDGTYGLSRSGIVSFIVPATMQAASLYSDTAYWFRIDNAHVNRTIRLYGLYPNTVIAHNITGVDDEILGSSNEQPGQQFTLTYSPVLPDLDLRVLEAVSLDDVAPLAAASSDSSASNDAAETPAPAGIRWRQVESFSLCGPTDRVYTLDAENGLVTFGDGYNGMIPPAGYNNIVAVRYAYTQGLAGNVDAASLTLLRPGIVNIEAVTNPAPASGGVDADTALTVAATGPALVKANGYAVELDDFSALAAAASQEVAQARAIETAEQTIRIVLLAQSSAPVPYTRPQVLNEVEAAVRARCLAPLAPRVRTAAPDFVVIDVSAQLAVRCAPDRINALEQDLAARLAAFFQPVFGGPDGGGWRFGQTVQSMTVSRFLRDLPQVGAVLSLSLNGRQNGNIALAPAQLPVAGRMSLFLYQEAAP
ncbi:hypothetical protein WM34_09085 [Burkholderia ubonensis]|uniref:baseplate J/gp47 family protein n=1 Tax=Burkholderia ubonensis TaxID=101571 RepID=UPI00075C71F6|nr:baseplate J/gp47 family protein [Burkholderia ubonensis]KWD01808.1 hypothetical protein WL59_18225 [Burkholderia ubonensis]KWD18800.1 hypothetical protein WL60_07390 [Burkholderia ubonensis]KWO96628.1 hypothetical protein WM34_09085 [Burkholderia ubonensis]